MTEILEAGSIAVCSSLAVASAWWRWQNLDKETIADALALRLAAYACGVRARKLAVAEAMKKEIVLR